MLSETRSSLRVQVNLPVKVILINISESYPTSNRSRREEVLQRVPVERLSICQCSRTASECLNHAWNAQSVTWTCGHAKIAGHKCVKDRQTIQRLGNLERYMSNITLECLQFFGGRGSFVFRKQLRKKKSKKKKRFRVPYLEREEAGRDGCDSAEKDGRRRDLVSRGNAVSTRACRTFTGVGGAGSGDRDGGCPAV
jgi:hypothetical protein